MGGEDKKNSSSWLLEEWKAPKTLRDWGYYRILHEVEGCKVKELTVGNLIGNPTSLKLIGGNVGDLLTTDGAGNVSWQPVAELGYGNSEVANYLPTFTGNLKAGNANLGNTVTANYFSVNKGITFPDGTTQNTAIGNPFDQDLNTTNSVEFSSVLSSGIVFNGTSSVFQRTNDTGLNIRSDVNKNPIYIYNYGSDGLGTNASEIDITENSVDIYAQYGTANQSKGSFKNMPSGEVLAGPNMILGSVNETDQLISNHGNHSISVISKDAISGISIYGAEATGYNPGTSIPLARKVIIYSGKDPSTNGRIELDAGGLVANSRSSIYMGSIEDPIRYYPSTGTPVANLETNMEIIGGLNSIGDVPISAGGRLGIGNSIVFSDGSMQNIAWTGTVDTGNVTGLGLYVTKAELDSLIAAYLASVGGNISINSLDGGNASSTFTSSIDGGEA